MFVLACVLSLIVLVFAVLLHAFTLRACSFPRLHSCCCSFTRRCFHASVVGFCGWPVFVSKELVRVSLTIDYHLYYMRVTCGVSLSVHVLEGAVDWAQVSRL